MIQDEVMSLCMYVLGENRAEEIAMTGGESGSAKVKIQEFGVREK